MQETKTSNIATRYFNDLRSGDLKSKITDSIREIILSQQELLIPWIIVLYSIGICGYFSLDHEPSVIYPAITLAILAILFRKSIIFAILFFVALGFLSTNLHAIWLNTPILKKEMKFSKIQGIISDITQTNTGKKIIIENPLIKNSNEELRKIRLVARTSLNNAAIGDEISIVANISPPPRKSIPDGYDFALRSYFEGIGAIGYAVSQAKIIKRNNPSNIITKIERLRNQIFSDIISIIGPRTGNIAAALMIGQYQSIDPKILENMRIAGISHILSVSGMHLSLMAMIFYFTTRLLINLAYKYTAKIDAKKVASLVALLGSLAYLLISGLQVAAIRSFIMVGLTIMAVIFDRINASIRAIFFAGLLILIISPENILNPSFQMSFAAVIALISGYSGYLKIFPISDNIFSKIKFYLLSTTYSSIIAGIATAPYVLYHFNQFSTYSIITNLLAVPLTSFIIMPCVILAFILYPLNLMQIALIPMKYAIEILIIITDYTAKLPYGAKITHAMPITSLILFSFGGLVICLFHHRSKLLGLIPIIIGSILMINNPMPILMIDGKTKIFAYLDQDHQLVVSSKKLSKFTKNLWFKYLGATKQKFYPQDISSNFQVKEGNCFYHTKGVKIRMDCKDKAYLHLTGEIISEKISLNINNESDSYFIYLIGGQFLIKSNARQNRLWQ